MFLGRTDDNNNFYLLGIMIVVWRPVPLHASIYQKSSSGHYNSTRHAGESRIVGAERPKSLHFVWIRKVVCAKTGSNARLACNTFGAQAHKRRFFFLTVVNYHTISEGCTGCACVHFWSTPRSIHSGVKLATAIFILKTNGPFQRNIYEVRSPRLNQKSVPILASSFRFRCCSVKLGCS